MRIKRGGYFSEMRWDKPVLFKHPVKCPVGVWFDTATVCNPNKRCRVELTDGRFGWRIRFTFDNGTVFVHDEKPSDKETCIVRESSFSGLMLDTFLAAKGQRRGMFVCCETHDDVVQVWDEVSL